MDTSAATATLGCRNVEDEVLPVQQVVLVWKLVDLLALDKQKSRAKQKALQQVGEELEKPQVSLHWVCPSALAEV